MSRKEKLKSMLDELSIDAFFVSHIPNIRYLSNFSGSFASLLITKNSDYFITDFRYKEQSHNEVKEFEILIEYEIVKALRNILIKDNLRNIGFETTHLSYKFYDSINSNSIDVHLIPLSEKVEELTIIKTEDELLKVKKAVEITDKTFAKVLDFLKPGISELDVSAEISYIQKKLGASKDAFEPIIASGWRGALPHGVASNKKIQNGEILTLDFGCIYEGFCSDMTRTIAIGKPSDEFKKIYNIVLNSQIKAINNAKANISSKFLDSIARDYISDYGYGEFFGHGLGHGLGLEVHELPHINWRVDYTLQNNSIITIEPGIYVPQLGGVRIEDDVLVKEDGCEVLNQTTKELIIL